MLLLASLLLAPALPFTAQPAVVQIDTVLITEWNVPWPNSRPRDPYYAPDGKVWFVGQTGNYIANLDPRTGQFARVEIEEGTYPHNLIVDRQGVVWYAGNRNGTIGKYEPATQKFTHYRMPDSTVRDPHTLVWDRNGDIWFTAQQSQAIGHLNTKTGEVRLVKVGGGARSNPYGIVVDKDNNAWSVLFATNKIARVDPRTMEVREYTLPRENARSRRLAMTSDGMIWYVDYSQGYLGRLNPATGEAKEWRAPRAQQSAPYAMAVDDKDRLWFFETGRGQPNQLVGFDPKTEQFFGHTTIASGGGAVRHAHFEPSTGELWFGTDTHTIGRAKLP
ncbi:MAG TPA: hypothetical protein VMM18_07360 [Gemmatimonadaceae bacterium]|nr:hypothetical protein [Gemmatimonadaceae bacterium]